MGNDPIRGPKFPRSFSGLRIPPKSWLLGGVAVIGVYLFTQSPHSASSGQGVLTSDVTPISAADIIATTKPVPPSLPPRAAPPVPPSPPPPQLAASDITGVPPQGTVNATLPPQTAPPAPPTLSPAALARQQRMDADRAAIDAPLVTAPVRVSVVARPKPNPSPPEDLWLRAGMSIGPITLYTSATSTLPELLVGYLAEPLWDSTHRHMIAPRGGKLIGKYGSGGGSFQISQNSTHLPASFSEIIVDDRVIALGDQPAIDPTGTSGLGATVDHHTAASIKDLLLVTAVGALMNRGGGNCGPNCAQSYGSGSSTGGAVVQAAQGMLQPKNAEQPTLHVAEGAQFDVMVTQDIRVREWQP